MDFFISRKQDTPLVPDQAYFIHTPLVLESWRCALEEHPNHPSAQFFLNRISEGFKIGHNYGSVCLKLAQKNLDSALQHKEVISEYFQTEIDNKRVAESFSKEETTGVQISRFGVIPKNHQPNNWRLIVDLSYLKGHSVNDGIPKSLCSLSYISVDDAIYHIITTGQHTLLVKIDIRMHSITSGPPSWQTSSSNGVGKCYILYLDTFPPLVSDLHQSCLIS